MKSPLRDNLNFKSLSLLKELIPRRSIISSFLFCSGALEVALASDRRFVIAHTNKYVVYEFWNCISTDPKAIARRATKFYNELLTEDESSFCPEKMFSSLQENWGKQKRSSIRAAYFFLLSRCSEERLPSSGKFNKKLFNPLSISTLKRYSCNNLHVQFDDEEDFMKALHTPEESDFLLFPVGKYSHNLFEHGKSRGHETTPVHHQEFYESLKEQHKKWIVLYKNHASVFDLYKDHNIIMVDQYGRKTSKKDDCEDIIIANF